MKTKYFLFSTLLMNLMLLGYSQDFKDLQIFDAPLTLKSQGSFFVGGETVEQTFEELGSFGPGSKITVNQMYVRYMVPLSEENKIPVIMIHGMALTGKTWETTPDGRMGWDEYFVRNGYSTYVVDQVARGRSGFNQAIFNNVAAGKLNASQLQMSRRFADQWVWRNFRIGEKENEPFENTKFPTKFLGELSKQGVPDLSYTLPNYNDNYKSLSELADNLGGAVLISHSQSGFFPMEAALINKEGIAGIVALEPGHCPTDLKKDQLELLAKIPILIIYGDYLDLPTGISHSWQTACEQCETFSKQVNELGGNTSLVRLADEGIKGNSHMLMHDVNYLSIADRIFNWISANNLNVD